MSICINTSFNKKESLNKTISFIKEVLQINSIELTTDARAHGYQMLFSSKEIKSLGIHIEIMSGGWCDFIRNETSMLLPQISLMKQLGTNKIRLFISNPHLPAETNIITFKKANSLIKKYARLYPDIYFLFENHGGLTANGLLTRHLMEEVDMFNVGLVYDPSNYIASGANPLEALGLTFKYIKHVHVKDINQNKEFCSVGEGITPWKKIIETLKLNDYNGVYSIEYEGKENPKLGIQKSLNNFRNLINE